MRNKTETVTFTLENNDEEEQTIVTLKANILGVEWVIMFGNHTNFPMLENCDGYADSSVREIIVSDMTDCANDFDRKKDMVSYQKRVVRHEVVHAYLMESGLETSSLPVDNWAGNEEMVDWIAIQAPKIFATFKELDVL